MSSNVPYGLSGGNLECISRAIKNMMPSLCATLTFINSEKERKGELIVCNGKVFKASINGKPVDSEKFFEELGEMEDHITLLFSPIPSELSDLSEMTAETLSNLDTNSQYVSSTGILALGKAVLGMLYKIESLGVEIADFSLQVKRKVAFLRIETDKELPWVQIERIALEYLSPLGIKRVVPG